MPRVLRFAEVFIAAAIVGGLMLFACATGASEIKGHVTCVEKVVDHYGNRYKRITVEFEDPKDGSTVHATADFLVQSPEAVRFGEEGRTVCLTRAGSTVGGLRLIPCHD